MPSIRSLMICGENSSVSDEAMASSKRLLAHETDIGVDREARRRQQPAQRGDVVAVEAEAVGQPSQRAMPPSSAPSPS